MNQERVNFRLLENVHKVVLDHGDEIVNLRKEVKEELGEITENMVVWYDALAIGKTREKVMELVEKDK